MIRHILVSIIALLAFVENVVATESKMLESRSVKEEAFLVVDCVVRTVIANGPDGPHSFLHRCNTYSDEEADGATGMAYDLPEWLLTEYATQFEAQPTTSVRIHGATISRTSTKVVSRSNLRSGSSSELLPEDKILAEEGSTVEVSDAPFRWSDRRHLTKKTGTSSVLLVRVSTNDGSVSINSDTMSQSFFGDSGTPRATYRDCSFGQLHFVPATGDHIENGVVELSLNLNIQEQVMSSLENILSSELRKKIGSFEDVDHVAFCVPSGAIITATYREWYGYAYIMDQKSYYNNEQCGYLSTVVHEFGHNFGLGHSGIPGGNSYGDKSGIMGFAYNQIGAPVMCFNPAKNWQFGWYSEKSSTISAANGAWRGRFYGYSDFDTSPGNVLLQVGDIQLQYNKIGNLNRDLVVTKDQIAITRSTLNENSRSDALGALDTSTTKLTINNFANGAALLIKVCGLVKETNGLSYYDLSIHFGDQSDVCGQPTPAFQQAAPTPGPTNDPTPGPTNPPVPLSPWPSPAPSTPVPTNRPTPNPTMRVSVL